MVRLIGCAVIVLGCSKPTDRPVQPSPPSPPAQAAADAAQAVESPAVATAPPAATPPAEVAEPPPPANDFDFDKLSHDDKVKFMKEKVMPAMKPAFQATDAKKFAAFTCKTCHGKNPQKSKYKMPNPALPKLDFAALKAGKGDPKMLELMDKTVKPEMAKLFNKPEMSQTQPDGFGCLHCHTQKKN